MNQKEFHVPMFVKGDIDGFIGLFIDNLVNLLIISGLCLAIGMPGEIVFGKIIPGTAVSVLAGNLFYSYLARRLAKKEGRGDVTALPYGINTVSLFAFFSFIIAPIFLSTNDAILAWHVGIVSAFISGFFEGIGAFFGEKIRSIVPRAALLCALAGIAIVFIALDHTVKMWDKPLIAFIPLGFIFIEYFSRVKLPFRIPAGFYALAFGSAIAWSTGAMDARALSDSVSSISPRLPEFAILGALAGTGVERILPYLSISVPMGLMAFFATIQNLESAQAAGDRFPATPVLAMNGIGTMIGAIFGSPFPTTVYIGHPGWKAIGARGGYSVINGAVVTIISFTGIMSVIVALVPLEAGYPILLWVGAVITAQAFQSTPREHAPAIAIGLMPAIASWGVGLLQQMINSTGGLSTAEINSRIAETLPHLKGIIAFSEGALFSSMFIAAVCVYLIEKDFLRAFFWTIPLMVFTYFGFIHSDRIGFGRSTDLFFGYMMFSLLLLFVFFYQRISIKKGE